MKLPNRASAYIPPPKLKDYLLSETHAVGKSKAKFLRGFGFTEVSIDLLEQGLLAIVYSEDVQETTSSAHGTKYIVEGSLETLSGDVVRMRTIWIIETGHERPRFVTAYPA